MLPNKPNIPLKGPKGFFLKKLGQKARIAGQEATDFEHTKAFLLPPATPPEPTAADKLAVVQANLHRIADNVTRAAICETVVGFLGRSPTNEEFAARVLWQHSNDSEGLEVSVFHFDGKPLFTRTLGFRGPKFVVEIELHPPA